MYLVVNSYLWKIFYYKFVNTFLHCNAKYQKSLRYDKAILDLGYFQNIISVFEKKVEFKKVKKYINLLLPADKLFIFNADQDIRCKRIENRDFSAREHFLVKNIEKNGTK